MDDLVPFVKFKKHEKNHAGVLLFVKVKALPRLFSRKNGGLSRNGRVAILY